MLYYRIKMTFDRPLDFSQRGWKEVLRGAMRAAAEHWHAEMLPRHFMQSARERYGYQPRTAGYQRSKVHAVMSGKAKSACDLILSGLTQQSAMQRPLIKAFPTRARLDLLVPPYIQMRPNPRGKRKAAPAMGDELTRVTYDEAEELANVAMHYIGTVLAPRSTSTAVFSARRRMGVALSTATTMTGAPEYMQSYTVICE